MSDVAKFKKHFLTTTADRLIKDKNKSVDEAREIAEKRYKQLAEDQEEFDERFNEWNAQQAKDGDAKGKRKAPAAPAVADDEAAPSGEKKKASKKKSKGKAPATDADGTSEDGEPKPKAKRAKRINPDEIEAPKKRVQFQTSVHFDKNGHMFFYNHKTNESSWHISAHDFNILFGGAVKELGLGAGGSKSKRGTRKSRLHGYHVFVKEFVPETTIDNPHEKGKERIRLAAAAWGKLTEADKAPWQAKAVKLNEEIAAKEKADAPSSSDEPAKEDAKAPKPKKAAKAVAVKADAGKDDWEGW
jgi:hypothetical protein